MSRNLANYKAFSFCLIVFSVFAVRFLCEACPTKCLLRLSGMRKQKMSRKKKTKISDKDVYVIVKENVYLKISRFEWLESITNSPFTLTIHLKRKPPDKPTSIREIVKRRKIRFH